LSPIVKAEDAQANVRLSVMPGLPKKPAAEKIDISSDGKITGIF